MDRDQFNKIDVESETIEEFLARGGEIKKFAYKKPPRWRETFNGHSKYDDRPGKVSKWAKFMI